MHGFLIKLHMMPARIVRPQGRTLRAVQQDVTVVPALRRKARMELFANRLHPAHRHGRWQIGIDAPHPGCLGALSRSLEMRDLA
jgi:hypothetical protein